MIEQAKHTSMMRVTLASLFGTTLEFYDHFIFGTASALIFPHVFFANMSSNLALLLSLATYGIAFLARPIGAVIFGHFGDRIGRKNILVLALLIMGGSTFLIGCLPDYTIAGSLGAYLLITLRLLQGIALGGEWGGAALMVNEFSKKSKYKGLLGSMVQIAAPLGFLLASAIFAFINFTMNTEQIHHWGWRIPFLLSAVLVIIGFYIRSHIDESPEFLQSHHSTKNIPIVLVVKHHFKSVLLAIGTRIGSDIAFYVFALFPLVYLPYIGVSKEVALIVGITSAFGQMLGTPIFGYLCDLYGTKKILSWGAVLNLIWSFAYIAILNTHHTIFIAIGAFLALFFLAAMWAPLATHLPSIFPVNVRYTGTSISFQAAGILGGAIAPSICLLLLNSTHNGYLIALYLGLTLLLALLCTLKTELKYVG